MSTTDTTPLVSAPWFDADGNPLPVRALPGLRPEVIQGFECSYPGIIKPTLRALLETCCGLAATEIGSIDFTGCWFPEEPCTVFRPCLTLAIDDAGRRWIAEIGDKDWPGPIWCLFHDPNVATYPGAKARAEVVDTSALRDRRNLRPIPAHIMQEPAIGQAAGPGTRPPIRCAHSGALDLRPCA
jgi:hypothetical protein